MCMKKAIFRNIMANEMTYYEGHWKDVDQVITVSHIFHNGIAALPSSTNLKKCIHKKIDNATENRPLSQFGPND